MLANYVEVLAQLYFVCNVYEKYSQAYQHNCLCVSEMSVHKRQHFVNIDKDDRVIAKQYAFVIIRDCCKN